MNFEYLRNETIGYGSYLEGPFGKKLITYADYTASGKSLRFLENYYLKLQETYANTHTEDDYTGKKMTQLYADAKNKIRSCVGANENYCVMATGTGATGAIEKLSKILGVYKTPQYLESKEQYLSTAQVKINTRDAVNKFDEAFSKTSPVIFISSYEHHSNEIQWREGHAEVVKIGLTKEGLFDLEALKQKVSLPQYKNRLKIGSFSAASNVTGVKTPIYDVARIMHNNGGYVFFDFAASGPYVDINMTKDAESYFDGIYLSMHKFIGGPGSAGLLVMNRALYNHSIRPCSIGGGTVKYVTDDDVAYNKTIESREDAGTPGIMQVIRAAMALEVKDAVGVEDIEAQEEDYIKRAFKELNDIEQIEVLGNHDPKNRLAILSFNVRYKEGYLHHGFVTTLLNDLFGIQSRAGCACAGPYGIELLNISSETVEHHKKALNAEINAMKPGWTRVNFHYTLDEATFNFIIEAIRFVATFGHEFLDQYSLSCVEGSWSYKGTKRTEEERLSLTDALLMKRGSLKTRKKSFDKMYTKYLKDAYAMRLKLSSNTDNHTLFGRESMQEIAWFYHVAM